MSGRIRLGLVFGGRSVEHEVSVSSARGVAEALRGTTLDYVPLGVTAEGRWLGPQLSRRILESKRERVEPEAGEDDGRAVVLQPGGARLLELLPDGRTRTLELDVLFPLAHGWGGEDGRFQGAVELVGLPYVGCGVAASAVAMDKILTRTLLDAHGIAGVRWFGLDGQAAKDHSAVEERIATTTGYPVFVKPANGGSSVGVHRVDEATLLPAALEAARACDGRVIVEAAVVDAREIECAVLGNERAEASVVGEIVPSGEFYDYAAKYLDGASKLVIPADLEPELAEKTRRIALEAYRILDLSGFARIDFLLHDATGQLFLNEPNSLPGFTPISMFPMLWEASGLPYGRLIERLVELAFERRESTRRRRIHWKPD